MKIIQESPTDPTTMVLIGDTFEEQQQIRLSVNRALRLREPYDGDRMTVKLIGLASLNGRPAPALPPQEAGNGSGDSTGAETENGPQTAPPAGSDGSGNDNTDGNEDGTDGKDAVNDRETRRP